MFLYMNDYETNVLKMVCLFLKRYESDLGNAGCNDFEFDNTDENWDLYKRSIYDNGDHEQIKYLEERGRPTKDKLMACDFEMVAACRLFLENKISENKK